MAIYNTATKDIILESAKERCNRITYNQLQSIHRIALSNMKDEHHYPYAIYDELYRFHRKEAINFLMTGVTEDFFEGSLDRNHILKLVTSFYCPLGANDE